MSALLQRPNPEPPPNIPDEIIVYGTPPPGVPLTTAAALLITSTYMDVGDLLSAFFIAGPGHDIFLHNAGTGGGSASAGVESSFDVADASVIDGEIERLEDRISDIERLIEELTSEIQEIDRKLSDLDNMQEMGVPDWLSLFAEANGIETQWGAASEIVIKAAETVLLQNKLDALDNRAYLQTQLSVAQSRLEGFSRIRLLMPDS